MVKYGNIFCLFQDYSIRFLCIIFVPNLKLVNCIQYLIKRTTWTVWHGSQSKYKCSIIQTEQNTTKNSKYKRDKIQKKKIQTPQNTKEQETNLTKYNYTKIQT